MRIDHSVFDLCKRPSRSGKESYPPKINFKKRASQRIGVLGVPAAPRTRGQRLI